MWQAARYSGCCRAGGSLWPCARYSAPEQLCLVVFSSFGFPDLETGSCRGGSANCGVFFPPLGFPDLETGSCLGSCRGGLLPRLTAFRIWPPPTILWFVFLALLSGFGNGVKSGKPRGGKTPTVGRNPRCTPMHVCHLTKFGNRWCAITGGAIQSPTQLCHRSFCSLGLPNLETRGWGSRR